MVWSEPGNVPLHLGGHNILWWNSKRRNHEPITLNLSRCQLRQRRQRNTGRGLREEGMFLNQNIVTSWWSDFNWEGRWHDMSFFSLLILLVSFIETQFHHYPRLAPNSHLSYFSLLNCRHVAPLLYRISFSYIKQFPHAQKSKYVSLKIFHSSHSILVILLSDIIQVMFLG